MTNAQLITFISSLESLSTYHESPPSFNPCDHPLYVPDKTNQSTSLAAETHPSMYENTIAFLNHSNLFVAFKTSRNTLLSLNSIYRKWNGFATTVQSYSLLLSGLIGTPTIMADDLWMQFFSVWHTVPLTSTTLVKGLFYTNIAHFMCRTFTNIIILVFLN